MLFKAATIASLAATALAEVEYSPIRPPAVPLAVRNPYTNVWSSTRNEGTLDTNGAMMWTGRDLGWTGVIEVDGTPFQWMGHSKDFYKAIPVSVDVDSQWSNFTYEAGGVDVTAHFFSPVLPDDICRMSIPLSYLEVSVSSKDKSGHHVRLYGDIDGFWSASFDNQTLEWSFGDNSENDKLKTFEIHLQEQLEFTEKLDTALYGNMTYTSSKGDAKEMTYQAGPADEVRKSLGGQRWPFSGDDTKKIGSHSWKHAHWGGQKGLANTIDTNFRPQGDDEPVFAFLHDLGKVKESEKSVLYSVGTLQDPGIQFNTTDGVRRLSPWWVKCYGTADKMIESHYNDFDIAATEANKLESKLRTDISKYYGTELDLTNGADSEESSYYSILALSVRQIFGAYLLTERPDNANHTDVPYVFTKEISSNGNMNTVDVIFPAMPFFAWSNVDIMRWLLDVVFQTQNMFKGDFALHDIGQHFPNATGYVNEADVYAMPLEECGNMIMMLHVYYEITKDKEYLVEHYHYLEQFAKYLLRYAEYPAEQLSTDDFQGKLANQTNLAMKGIVGIASMSELAKIVGDEEGVANYTKEAERIYSSWKENTVAIRESDGKEFTKLSYNDTNSWGTLYNAWPAYLLDLNVGGTLISDAQKWAESLLEHEEEYGIPLDSRSVECKTDWKLWLAAYAKPNIRNNMITTLARFLKETTTDKAFTDMYDVTNAKYPDKEYPDGGSMMFIARPVVGGHFSLLANLVFGKDHSDV